ncbi:unnamed protein product [Linum trigynum]|uniref:Uncharacterized protein n=1 Tax=Linum trigynum TaxID=586398 RepID=A0AAV2CD52_9ROSI
MAAQQSPPAPAAQTLEMFHPSVWGDFFLTNPSQTQQTVSGWNVQVLALKQDVERMLRATSDKPAQKLSFIDVVQRLGIGYLFETEIDHQIQLIYYNHHSCSLGYDDGDDGELSAVSLRFRLMRQHGYHVPSDVFNKFKDVDGKFKSELSSDIQGILSLYEAAHLGVPGENILDEAIDFTATCLLKYSAEHLDSDEALAERVSHALKRPLRKGVEKQEQLFFISMYEQDRNHDPTLLGLAKLCFNVVQDLYQKELRALTKWWVELDLASKLPFARDRLVEVYFWSLATMWEPKHSLSRHFLTKVTVLVSTLDDIYDVKATIDELELFTAAISSWVKTDVDDLPEYMGHWMEAMASVVDEIASREGRGYCAEYARLAVRNQAKAYLSEARWLAEKVVPSVDEYRRVGIYSCCYPLLAVAALCGMEDETMASFDWLLDDPAILVASSDMCRLMDDVVSHEFEQERGHVASSVECYMKQYGVGKVEAREAINKMIEEDWKMINEELLVKQSSKDIGLEEFRPTKQVMSVFLGLARVMDVLYKDSDGYTHANKDTKDIITALLVTPIII